jgi:hypothetical protein
MKRIATFVLFTVLPLAAGSIDVSEQSFARVPTGADVTVEFGVSNYGFQNPGFSPYPDSFGFSVLTENPADATALVPGSSTNHYPRYLLQGWAESLDGSVSVPLFDPLAAALGYGSGTLVLAPGLYETGASDLPVGVLSAMVSLTPDTAAALFGDAFTARIVLVNLGIGVTLGIDPDYTVRQAVSETELAGAGPSDVAGVTRSVTVENPEPAAWTLVGAAAAVFLTGRLRSCAARSSKC